jgi:hypothetical protein
MQGRSFAGKVINYQKGRETKALLSRPRFESSGSSLLQKPKVVNSCREMSLYLNYALLSAQA